MMETKNISLSGDDELDNQRCPKCNQVYDFEIRRTHGLPAEYNGGYRFFERQKHVCKK